jgi:hypothetical protein
MMVKSDKRKLVRPVTLTAAILRVLLSVVLLFVAMVILARLHVGAKAAGAAASHLERTPSATAGGLLMLLLFGVVPVAALLWLRPWQAITALADEPPVEDGPPNLKPQIMSALLGFLAMAGLSGAAGIVGVVLYSPTITRPVNLLTWAFCGLFLLIGLFSLWGILRLRTWAQREPMSPATRRTNGLFGLSGLVATAACVALIIGIEDWQGGAYGGLFSDSPVALWFALAAILLWLASWALAWLWYFSADEHEQRASDVGLLVGGLLFGVVTPVWWVAARAGLVPQPNAMVLWFAFNLIWTAGWFWRRSR